ncbi:beige/BEACH/WD domain containing protein [Artemisia annua]|uniref:Beige/BEACH/WD domain containing protein n=1 Tax=Artemisia annua TaxID=35608 RepID=A0A2U1KXP6_ARTAN|nr:beige/BEACH/WD domain containing protein [Artemisia annua]
MVLHFLNFGQTLARTQFLCSSLSLPVPQGQPQQERDEEVHGLDAPDVDLLDLSISDIDGSLQTNDYNFHEDSEHVNSATEGGPRDCLHQILVFFPHERLAVQVQEKLIHNAITSMKAAVLLQHWTQHCPSSNQNFYIDQSGCICEKETEDEVSFIDQALGVTRDFSMSMDSQSKLASSWGATTKAHTGGRASAYNGGAWVKEKLVTVGSYTFSDFFGYNTANSSSFCTRQTPLLFATRLLWNSALNGRIGSFLTGVRIALMGVFGLFLKWLQEVEDSLLFVLFLLLNPGIRFWFTSSLERIKEMLVATLAESSMSLSDFIIESLIDKLEQKTVGSDKKIKELETLIHIKDEALDGVSITGSNTHISHKLRLEDLVYKPYCLAFKFHNWIKYPYRFICFVTNWAYGFSKEFTKMRSWVKAVQGIPSLLRDCQQGESSSIDKSVLCESIENVISKDISLNQTNNVVGIDRSVLYKSIENVINEDVSLNQTNNVVEMPSTTAIDNLQCTNEGITEDNELQDCNDDMEFEYNDYVKGISKGI